MRTHTSLFATLLITACLTSGCGGSSGGGGGDDGDDGSGQLEPTLSSIQDNIFTPVCTECHAGTTAPEGLRLEEGLAYDNLVEIPSEQVPELFRVEPNAPDNSYLVRKLEGTQSVGARMPRNGPPFLEQSEIDVIRQWISDGAMDDGSGGIASMHAGNSGPTVRHSWPMDQSAIQEPPRNLIVAFDREMDTTLLHDRSITLQQLDNIDPATLQPLQVTGARLHVTRQSPTTIRIAVPDAAWSPGRYELRISGDGPYAVAGHGGQSLDGDADGNAGGDFVLRFTLEARQ